MNQSKQNRIKILLVHSGEFWSGSALAMLNLMEALRNSGNYEVSVLLDKQGPVYKKYQENGYPCKVTSIPNLGRAGGGRIGIIHVLKFIFRYLFNYSKLKRLLLPNNFDCVYLNSGVIYSVALTCNSLNIPVVWQLRELLDEKSIIGRNFCKSIFNKSHSIIATSHRIASTIGSHGKIHVVYDGVSEEYSKILDETAVERIRTGWGYNSNNIVLGLIAPITWYKGHQVLVDALPAVIEEYDDVRVVFIGGSTTPENYSHTLRGRIKKMIGGISDAEEHLKIRVSDLSLQKYVRFDGWSYGRTLIEKMHAIDILIFPSTIPEGFGLPVAEAAMAGKPAIATNLGALPELIQNGYSGWLIPQNAPFELSNIIRMAAGNPSKLKIVGKNAQNIAIHRFSLSQYQKNILEVFDSIIISVKANKKNR